MSTPPPENITSRYLRMIRKRFYARRTEKFFFQERNLLVQAITYPADWLHERGVKLPSERYATILNAILRTIAAEGNVTEVRSPGRYLLHCVQTHMQHQGDTYYQQAVTLRNLMDGVMHGLIRERQRVDQAQSVGADNTVPELAAAYRILASKSGRKKAHPKAPQQQTLF